MNYRDSDHMIECAQFVLEASTYEHLHLWVDNKKDTNWSGNRSVGYLITLGKVDNRPVCVSIEIANILGKDVLLVEPTSALFDYKMMEEFFKGEGFPKIHIAENFHHLLNEIRNQGE